jgi:hypothetical protein
MFAGYSTVWVDTSGMGLRDAVNYAYAIASGGEIPDTESIGRARMIQMRPDLAHDSEFSEMSWPEILDSDEYQDLH